ncbi:MAG: hypothetical protein HY021_04980 [Burkholderiales bacterium]|nr:hypothetical protein [Burkholderiales bacterium]
MAQWLAASERDAHHAAHRYALEDFGLDAATVEARFGFVRRRHGIAVESTIRATPPL